MFELAKGVSRSRDWRSAAIVSLALLVLPATSALAQRAAELNAGNQQGSAAAPGETKVVPTIRTNIYDRLNEAQVCMDEGDNQCALEVLDRLESLRDLNNYEIAQLWNFRAFIYFDLDDLAGAIRAYETILGLPFEDIPDGVIQSSMRNLATLYLQDENYEKGLETYQRWMDLPTVTPNSSDWYLLATIYYQMERYADGIPAIEEAIALANANGSIGEESWFQLLYVFYFQLEQTDKVIETLTFMVENWTKRDWVIALAGQMSGQDREDETLALYEAAYEAGWLTRSTELVQLANLYLNARSPYKAAILLDDGLADGSIDSSQVNWRLLAQAWQLAAEHERAIPAFQRASELSDDGDMDRMLSQSYARLAQWDNCADAARAALEKGGLDRTDLVQMQLGQCLMNQKRFQESLVVFQEVARDDRQAQTARRWVTFIQEQIRREATNQEALRSLQEGI